MSDEFIPDDTDLGLLEKTNFQVVDRIDPSEVDSFADEVEELSRDDISPSRNPYLRVAIGGGVALLALVFAFFSTLGDNKAPDVVQEAPTDESELTLTAEPSSEATEEIELLRSELALLQQQLALEEVDRRNNPAAQAGQTSQFTEDRHAPLSSQSPPRPGQTTGAVKPAPARAVPVSTASPVAAPIRRPPPRPVPRSTPPPVSVSVPPPSPTRLPLPDVPAYEPVDPEEAWLAASNAGIFGSTPPLSVSEPAVTMPPATSHENAVSATPSRQPQLKNGMDNATLMQYSRQVEAVPSAAIPGLLDRQPVQIPLGTAVAATVVTPIVWLNADDQFMIELQEEVKGNNEQVIIPSGSLIVVQAIEVDENSGFAQLAAVGVSINERLIPIDYKNVAIRGKGGDPLVADRYGDVGRDIASNDLEMFAIGALGEVGHVLNRPNSQTITNGNFGSTSSTDYDEPNMLGAVLAGGAEQLTERMSSRNDERLADIRERDAIFYLPEGKAVQFYVNSSFSI